MGQQLPEYARRLDALHRALEDDFRGIVARAPLAADATVVDAGCGDGFFTGLLCERLTRGEVIALDTSPEFLAAARERLAGQHGTGRCRFVEGSVLKLPLQDASLDAVFSAHSMQSYPSIPTALAEFRRVLKPGGSLVVLESDAVHSIMLSWPPDLELAVREAEQRQIGDEDSYIGTYFPRFAARLLAEAGFSALRREYVHIHRQRPASADVAQYVALYLGDLRQKFGEHLSEPANRRLAALATPGSDRFLPEQANFYLGSLQVLITAVRGAET